GEDVSVHVLDAAREPLSDLRASAERLRELADFGGIMGVREIDAEGRWYVADPILGFAMDLPAFGWKLDRKLRFMGGLGEALEERDRRGIGVGVLAAENVAIDPMLRPVLTELGPSKSPGLTAAYAAPEVKAHRAFDARADVYSVGRLLAFALTGVEP